MEKRKRLVKYMLLTAAAALFAFFYLRCMYHLVLQTNMDSDYNYLLTEADEVLHGNFFLRGWTQTGISFFLTDLLFFMAGAAVFGVTRMGYVAAVVLMIACVFAAGYLLIGKKNFRNTVLYIALTALPTVASINMQRSHTGGFIWCFLTFAVAGWCVYKERVSAVLAGAVVLLTALCSMSDMAALIFGGGALLLVCGYRLLFDRNMNKKLYSVLAGAVLAGAALGLVMDKLYYWIGGADKNSFLGDKIWIDVEELWSKLCLYVKSTFVLGGGDFWGQKIFSIDTVISLLYAVFIAVGLYLMVKNIVLFLRHKNDDMISVLLSVGLALVSLLFIFTGIGIDVYSSRYFGTFPYMMAVLLCRYLTRTGLYEKKIDTSRIRWKYPVLALAVLAFTGSVYRYADSTQEWAYTSEQELLGRYLQEQGLKSGYGSFFDSSAVSVPTGGAVTVRQIILNGESYIFPYYWFCKQEWYAQEANFIILPEDGENFGLTEGTVQKVVGRPSKRLTYGSYVIYVYDRDLSEMINLDDWRDR